MLKSKLKKSVAILLATTMMLSLAACGEDAAPTDTTAPTPATSEGAAATETSTDATTGEPKNIVILSVNQTEEPEGPLEKQIADDFMAENPDITIEFQGVPMNELFKRITTLAASNTMPDMFTMTTEFMPNLASMGVAADLNTVLDESFLQEFYPDMLEEASVDGKLMFLPWYATPPALIYRADWFEAEGLEPPETWDDVIEAGQKLTKDTDGDGVVDQYGLTILGTRNQSGEGRFCYFMRTFGAEELRQEADGTWVTDIGSEEYKAALQTFTDFDLKYGMVPPGVIETGYPEATQFLVSEKAAMMITGPNALGTIYNQNPELQGKFASVPIPMDTQHVSTNGLLGYAVSESSQVKPEISRYMEFLTNDENSLMWNEKSGRLPTRMSLADDPQLQTPEMKGFVDSLQYAYRLPTSTAYTEVLDILGEAYQSVFTGEATVDEAAAKAQTKAEESIKNNP